MAEGRAPGKVILCGEHAVVHGSAAVAAAIGLYTQVQVSHGDDQLLHLELVELGLSLDWEMQSIRNSLDQEADPTLVRPCSEALSIQLKHLVESCGIFSSDTHSGVPAGVMAFLFLYSSIVGLKPGVVRIESKIPMSCGLGSSAAFSVALTVSLLAYTRQVCSKDAALPVDSQGCWASVSAADADLVNRWAFEAEKIIHGNPSGIDNTVSTYGNLVKYKKSEMTLLSDLPSLRILLTNTRVLRNTNQLVAGVGLRKKNHPQVMSWIFEAVNAISEEFIEILQTITSDGVQMSEQENKLEELVVMNHSLLQGMGVSHSSIEMIVAITVKYSLKSKLTGAGGGGCVMTLLPKDLSAKTLQSAMEELSAAGFECFEAELGAKGAQVLRR